MTTEKNVKETPLRFIKAALLSFWEKRNIFKGLNH
jgi:hypothetical protein